MRWPGIGFPMKLDERKRYFCSDIVRLEGDRAIQRGCLLSVAPENSVTDRDLLQREEVARIEINRVLQVLCGFFPESLAPLNETLQLEYPGIIGQSLAGNSQLGQSAVIIEVSPIKIPRTREVRFTRIGTKASCRLNGCFRQRQALRSMVEAKKVKRVMSVGELAIRPEKCWGTGAGLGRQ